MGGTTVWLLAYYKTIIPALEAFGLELDTDRHRNDAR